MSGRHVARCSAIMLRTAHGQPKEQKPWTGRRSQTDRLSRESIYRFHRPPTFFSAVTSKDPRAQWKSVEEFDRPHPFTVPFYISNSLRLVMYSHELRLTRVIITTDPDVVVSDSVELVLLADCDVPSMLPGERWYDYRKGVFTRHQRAYLLSYKWPVNSCPGTTPIHL
ncbi:hypothetical protein CC1G_05396 [Coprinopsis cinerea okayama7|uniref:Uncharacterized protein n=1 Tax=Coprinopsis cinerea (strain Okayama-7 / 130 / ATCC MYA-4618 / FGSC 9003) TaxID=240176 RepID=A8NPY6_COPC7|nr:hypothetical protein CC1G_05396 [Coprinopsis cinerea okayama7\|eukprot:XP_001835434.2 hypothetical protein CC1G_05396 [Coprinopsis cinerea okayama7\